MFDLIRKTILSSGDGDAGTMVNAGEALLILLIAMLVIFAVLVILMGVLYLLKYINKMLEKNNPGKQEKIAGNLPVKIEVENDDDEALVAAITAAVKIYMETENISAPFIIKNIKKLK